MILSQRLQEQINRHMAEGEYDENFVFFDFDGTLTTKDSLLPFLKFCVGSINYYLKLCLASPILALYLLGIIPNYKAKEFILKWYLKGWSKQKLQDYSMNFVNNCLPNLICRQGIEKLHHHQRAGDYCVLVSASLEIYLEYWAKAYNFDALCGTKIMFENEVFLGKLLGGNCFGDEKVLRINSEFGEACWINSSAYSDSKVDLPMLQHAKKGYLLENDNFIVIPN